ncbi:MAG: hypothetical protein ABIJ30_13605 [bacterium]
MICMDAWTSIRFLHSKGESLRWIARELGVSRNTVRIAQQKINPVKHLRIILVLLKYYSVEQVKQVMARACELNCYSHSIIEGLLRREMDIEIKCSGIIKGKGCEMGVNVERDLMEYDKILS